MAIDATVTDIVQEVIDSRVDMQSFASFMFEPAGVMITRRLAPDTHSFQHYLAYFEGLKAVFAQEAGTVIVDGIEVTSIQQLIDDALVAIANSGGRFAYKTYTEMTAAAALPAEDPLKLPANSVIEITNDTTANNGVYLYNGSTFIKSTYDLLALSKTYTDTAKQEAINAAVTQSNDYADGLLDGFDSIEESDEPFEILDAKGRAALNVDDEGVTNAAKLSAVILEIKEGSTIEKDVSSALSARDSHDKAAFKLKDDGTLDIARISSENISYKGVELLDLFAERTDLETPLDIEAIATALTPVGDNYPANINHFEIYGQSLSQGALSTPIQTTTQPYDSLMFSGGVRPQNPSYTVDNFYADFIPLIEKGTVNGYKGYETPVGGATEAVKQLIAAENGVNFNEQEYRLLGSACGAGGVTIAALSTTLFDANLKPAITAAYNLAQSKGQTYAMPYIGWVQGENDNKIEGISGEAYKNAMQAMIAKISAHLKTLDGNLALKGLITTQLASFTSIPRTDPKIENSLYEAATAKDSNVFLACPLYIFDYQDHFHVDGVSSKWMGAYIGLVYKRLVVDGVRWRHLQPISHKKQGRILEVKYHVPVKPLVVDTTQVALNTNYGFTIVDSAGTNIAIESVEVTQPDTIRFITANPLPVGAELRYAYTPNASTASGGLGRLTGARGNIRDSQGNDIVFDPTGINKPLHNWLPIHYYKL